MTTFVQVSRGQIIEPAHINQYGDAINALETNLTPSGTASLFPRLGVGDTASPSTSALLVEKFFSSGTGAVSADFQIHSTGASGDLGAIRAMAFRTTAGGASDQLRAVEAHTVRYAAATSGLFNAIGEWGLHSEIASVTTRDNLGLWLSSYNWPGSPTMSGAVRMNSAILVDGAAGWKNGYLYLSTDNATVLAKIDQTGKGSFAGNLEPTVASTTSLGNPVGALYMSAVYSDNVLITGASGGSAAAPLLTWIAETNNGIFWDPGIIGMTTAGVARLTAGLGIQVGAPTGGDKGAGTANFAADIYKNNTAYTSPDFVFEHAYTGKVVRFRDRMASMGIADYRRPSLTDLEAYTREHHHFPYFGDDAGNGLFSGSERLLMVTEELALHLFDVNRRLMSLEAR